MLRPYLKIWKWELIFGRAVKTISSPGVRSRYVVSLCCQYVSGFRQICAHGQIMFNKFNYSHYLIFSYQHSLSSQITCFPPSLLLSSWKIPPLSSFHSLASLGTKCHTSLASNIFACTHIMHWIKIVYVIKSVFFFYRVNLQYPMFFSKWNMQSNYSLLYPSTWPFILFP